MIIINNILAAIFSISLGWITAYIKPKGLGLSILTLLVTVEVFCIINFPIFQIFLFGRAS